MSNPVTLNFQLPLLFPNQAQKDVVVNTDLTAIDSLIQLNVLNHTLDAAPTNPNDQDKYIVGTAPTGVWAGQANSIAVYQANGSTWTFYAPKNGWVAYAVAQNTLLVFASASWVTLGTTSLTNNLGAIAALASVQNLLDIANMTPTNNILIQGNGAHFVTATPAQAVSQVVAMMAVIFGG